jgi:peptidoglycan/LPS O-acetylase OafA/YrhL
MTAATVAQRHSRTWSTPTMKLIQPATLYRPELDGLRFVAFLLVFICHTQVLTEAPQFLFGGAYGVDLFFLLSAYLITELFRREVARTGGIDIGAFYWRRILRIWPLYFSFVIAMTCISLVSRSPSLQMTHVTVLSLIFFWFNWYMAANPLFFAPVNPLWSVSIEEQFYAVIPWAMRWLSLRGLAIAAGMVIVVAVVSRTIMMLWFGVNSSLWFATFTRGDPIATGILLAIVLRGRVPSMPLFVRGLLASFGIGCMVVANSVFGGVNPVTVLDGSLSFPLADIGALALLLSFMGASVTFAPLLYLGRISYGLYVFHLFVLQGITHLVLHTFGIHPWWGIAPPALLITICLAAVSYRWLEQPFLRLKGSPPRF